MRVSHKFSAEFDDDNLIATAGLVPAMLLAESAGLLELVDEFVTVAGSAGANADVKVGTLGRGWSPARTASATWTCCGMAGWVAPLTSTGRPRHWAHPSTRLQVRPRSSAGRSGVPAADRTGGAGTGAGAWGR